MLQEDVPTRLALLNAALAAQDGPQILAEAHQLKGSVGNLGLARFADLAARIESLVREGHLEEAPRLAEALPAAYEEALHALLAAYPAS